MLMETRKKYLVLVCKVNQTCLQRERFRNTETENQPLDVLYLSSPKKIYVDISQDNERKYGG
jgi:hypothetical protein